MLFRLWDSAPTCVCTWTTCLPISCGASSGPGTMCFVYQRELQFQSIHIAIEQRYFYTPIQYTETMSHTNLLGRWFITQCNATRHCRQNTKKTNTMLQSFSRAFVCLARIPCLIKLGPTWEMAENDYKSRKQRLSYNIRNCRRESMET